MILSLHIYVKYTLTLIILYIVNENITVTWSQEPSDGMRNINSKVYWKARIFASSYSDITFSIHNLEILKYLEFQVNQT